MLGRTGAEQWRDRIRALPGPWAELATSKVVLTVPSSVVRGLHDPEPVLRFWDRALDAAADLAARPRDRDRPERYCADVQISAGYMHSGYPIMTHLDAAADMVHLEKLSSGTWGCSTNSATTTRIGTGRSAARRRSRSTCSRST
ncbi:MAG: hypothetical protein Fur0037_10900 [Planctomycetota bacterium]